MSDVTSKESLEKLVEEIQKTEDHVDVLICNAGISGPKAEPDETNIDRLKSKLWDNDDFESWSNVFTTNVSAVYFTTLAFLPLLKRSSGGNIITTSSMSGLTQSSQGHFAYNASKAACIHLTKMMSAEFTKVASPLCLLAFVRRRELTGRRWGSASTR